MNSSVINAARVQLFIVTSTAMAMSMLAIAWPVQFQ